MNSYDEEEQEIIDAFEAGTLKSQKPSPETLERHRNYARSPLSKDQRVNIGESSSSSPPRSQRQADPPRHERHAA